MYWSPSGVSKMRERMELADYELDTIISVHSTVVRYFIRLKIC